MCVACAAPSAGDAPPSATVRIEDIAFKPRRLDVVERTLVTWHFLDVVTQHNIRSRGRPAFRRSADMFDGTHTVTFRRVGVYRYECTLHPGMTGRVTVQPR